MGASFETTCKFKRRLNPRPTSIAFPFFVKRDGGRYLRARRFDQAMRALAKRSLERLVERTRDGQYVAAAHFARACLRLDDKDQVFKWLDKARNERNALSLLINTDPVYDCVRTDLRFAMVRAAMNLR